MTFEELKFAILDKQRRTEINKLFHLYVKAQSYSDILQLLKSEANFEWVLENGFMDFVQYFPDEELVNHGIYNGKNVELANVNTNIFLFNGSSLELYQGDDNRCKITIENGSAEITVSGNSMVEVESYQRARGVINAYCGGLGYFYLTAKNNTRAALKMGQQSTAYISAWQNSYITGSLTSDSYIYADLNDTATLTTNSENVNVKKNDKSKIITQ